LADGIPKLPGFHEFKTLQFAWPY